MTPLLLVLLHPLLSADDLLPLQLRGELLQRTAGGLAPVESFEVFALLDRESGAMRSLLSQRGRNRSVWMQAYGLLQPVAVGAGAADPAAPAVHYQHDGIPYRIEPVALSVAGAADLSEDQTWTVGRRVFRVGRSTRFRDRDCCELHVQDGPARKHTLTVDRQSGAVVKLEQRVFMGRGDEFLLRFEVTDGPEDAASEGRLRLFESLLSVQRRLRGSEDAAPETLNDEQRALAEAALPALRRLATERWAADFVGEISRDLEERKVRAAKLASMRAVKVGSVPKPWSVQLVDNKALDSATLGGKPVLLHFWQYRDSPLSEPYGQTGYLDFLAGQLGDAVQIVGVNVDPRYGDQQGSALADRSARKLKEFMNLSYRIARDDGALLESFGDPRPAGGKLPLWVVIDREGRIVHHKSGFYTVDPREGLKELMELIKPLTR